MAIPLIPWEPCNIPDEVQAELNRRKVNRSFVYVNGAKGDWDKDSGDWNKYRGPMSPWVRFCSNGMGRSDPDGNFTKQGFVFFGGKDFYTGYGFSGFAAGQVGGNQQVIGFVPNTAHDTHTIDNFLPTSNYPVHVPAPEIEKIQVTIQKELFRRASVEWTCFSKQQLEYMTPYFLIPGISCTLEWGWNHYDPRSLIDLTDTNGLKKLFNNPYPLYTNHILQSRGNYDVIMGIVTHFEWSVEGNKFKCKTEITSKDRIYSGLSIDASAASAQDKKSKFEENVEKAKQPMDTLGQFVDKYLPLFKGVNSSKNPVSIPELASFIKYVVKNHPDNWRDYVYGVFYGRDLEDKKSPLWDGRSDQDFDKSENAMTWLNLGLVMEVINFHSAPLTGMKAKEMFRIDIDDVVIGGHPNLISSDGTVCLIPNAEAPKYFYGNYSALSQDFEEHSADYAVLKNSTNPVINVKNFKEAAATNKLADWRVKKICGQNDGAFRDDLDEIINQIRYNYFSNTTGKDTATSAFEFPFLYDMDIVPGSKPYPARYSGYLKNIYVSVSFLKDLLSRSDEIKTYPNLVEKIMEGISAACGQFWDFRLVSATGKDGLGEDEVATMKVVDYKFMSFANRGNVYSFDYFDSDSLLLGLNFKPTLSNAQAIRTIYAPTNNPEKNTVITNGNNELLDYKFKDRLRFDDDTKDPLPAIDRDNSGFKETMRDLQTIAPCNGCYPITCKGNKGKVIKRRLVLPDNDVLQLLLDDGDEENNPKYTGIMPGIQASFTIQGIGGLRTFMMFLVRNLPEPYSHTNIVFRVVDVQEAIEAGKWTTTITAGVIPLREHIKKRLGVSFGKTS